MQSQQKYPIILFSATLLAGLTGQWASAFTITPLASSDPFNVPSASYSLNGGQGATNLEPLSILAPPGKTSAFWGKLTSTFSDWTFKAADNDLRGSFDIQKYRAIGTPSVVVAVDVLGLPLATV